jgi:hypothetical protein
MTQDAPGGDTADTAGTAARGEIILPCPYHVLRAVMLQPLIIYSTGPVQSRRGP